MSYMLLNLLHTVAAKTIAWPVRHHSQLYILFFFYFVLNIMNENVTFNVAIKLSFNLVFLFKELFLHEQKKKNYKKRCIHDNVSHGLPHLTHNSIQRTSKFVQLKYIVLPTNFVSIEKRRRRTKKNGMCDKNYGNFCRFDEMQTRTEFNLNLIQLVLCENCPTRTLRLIKTLRLHRWKQLKSAIG